MKIVAGMGSIDDYIRLVESGADEVFCGFVPYEWNNKYCNIMPLNRREVIYYDVQIGSFQDMKILMKMVKKYKVPVSIAFNSIYYIEEQYPIIADIIKKLIDIGFTDYIIADLGLIIYLDKNNIKCNIHLSGECAEINRNSIRFFNQFKSINRYIFHRKNTISDMKRCIDDNKDNKLYFEAFLMNERCHYTGAFCSSLHCDELVHLCNVPYIMAKKDIHSNDFPNVDKMFNDYYDDFIDDEDIENEEYDSSYILGSTGCGICALKRLKDAGVTHLKVVGRGNFIENMEQDIRNIKKSLDILKEIENSRSSENIEEEFKRRIKEEIAVKGCSKKCYYYVD